MPRVTTPQEVAKPANSMVASATVMSGTSRRVWTNKEPWQAEAWRMYDTIGELRYAANWVGNVLSRAILHVVQRSALGLWEPVDTGPGAAALDDLFGGRDGQPQMLKSIGIHFFVAGECYLVGRKPQPQRGEMGTEDIWEIVSTEEMLYGSGVWQIDYGDNTGVITLTEEDVVIRMWMPHPRKHMMADSPVKAQLATLRELHLLSRRVTAQVTSQIAGNGLIFIPSETTFPSDPEKPNQSAADGLMQLLGNTMLEAIQDPSSPASVVPVIVSTPGEYVDKVNKIDLFTEFDAQLPELRKEAIGRLAVGLDIPAEVMLGTADMNHWSAWQVEESSIKVNIEPMLEAIGRNLATGYLWPITSNTAETVGHDTSQLRLRPNRSKEAIELWDRGELSGQAMRRETGFDENDVPSDDERKFWLIRKIASGSASPEMVAQAAQLLGVDGIQSNDQGMNEARPAPSLDQHPVRELPKQAASLLDKSEVVMYRAMERAGNRLRSIKQIRPDAAAVDTYLHVTCTPGDLDRVLEDAWSVVDRVFDDVKPVERQVIVRALDTYARDLLLTRQPMSRGELHRRLLTTAVRELP